MSIVATEIVSDHTAGASRLIVYRCQDGTGEWHRFGPVYANADFDADAHKVKVAALLETWLAEREADQMVGG